LHIIKKLTILLLIINSLVAKEIIINNLEEKLLTSSGLSYILKADKKTIDAKKLKKLNFFNRKKIISNSLYYTNGDFSKKNIKVHFKKGYFLEGDFYMQDCFSSYNGAYIKSKQAKYKKSYIEFSGVVMKKNDKIYHKFRYRVDTK